MTCFHFDIKNFHQNWRIFWNLVHDVELIWVYKGKSQKCTTLIFFALISRYFISLVWYFRGTRELYRRCVDEKKVMTKSWILTWISADIQCIDIFNLNFHWLFHACFFIWYNSLLPLKYQTKLIKCLEMRTKRK